MKHVKIISRLPRKAAYDASIGEIVSVVAQILSVIGTALVAKE